MRLPCRVTANDIDKFCVYEKVPKNLAIDSMKVGFVAAFLGTKANHLPSVKGSQLCHWHTFTAHFLWLAPIWKIIPLVCLSEQQRKHR